MADDSLIWIKTRDGSPTLWSNRISEPFRSTKGAFSESWAAFVSPALKSLQLSRSGNVEQAVHVGEFGLGPGTNWLIWNVAARMLGIRFTYTVIENEISYFEAGLKKWAAMAPEVIAFVEGVLGQPASPQILSDLAGETFVRPKVHSTLHAAIAAKADPVDIWFHDPFGFAVNPEGYSAEIMALCYQLWSPKIAGFSYAVNRPLREAVKSLHPGMTFKNVYTGEKSLKRNRSEFYGPEHAYCADTTS